MVVHHLKIIQANLNKSSPATESLLQRAVELQADILCIQEPWFYPQEEGNWEGVQSTSHPAFTQISPNTNPENRPRTLVYLSKSSTIPFNLSTKYPQKDPDFQALHFKDKTWDFHLLNIYNQKREQASTFQDILKAQEIGQSTLLVEDFNAYYSL